MRNSEHNGVFLVLPVWCGHGSAMSLRTAYLLTDLIPQPLTTHA